MPYRIMHQKTVDWRQQIRPTYSRLVSLVPSQTELLYQFGLDEQVLGITRFCIHPKAWFQSKPRVGGTKDVQLDRLAALKPDLVIANKEENLRTQVEAISCDMADVYVSDITTLQDACQMITDLGWLTGCQVAAEQTVAGIHESFSHHLPATIADPLRCAYFIWKKPWMVAGGDTFIHHMLHLGGFCNVFAEAIRYPEVSIDDDRLQQADVLILSSEPYPFSQRHIDELPAIFPQKQIALADGELLSWYGSRLLHTAGYLRQLRMGLRL